MRAKIATKSLRAGPVLAARKREKHQNHKQIPAGRASFCENTCFSQFLARRTSRAVYQRGRKKKRKSRARVAARSEIPMGTARRARKKRGWRKKLCFLRAPPGGNSYCDLHRAHEIFVKRNRKTVRDAAKRGRFSPITIAGRDELLKASTRQFFLVCQRKMSKIPTHGVLRNPKKGKKNM